MSEEEQYGPHRHDADEYPGLIGSNLEDFRDLCGEVEWWFEDEKYIITKSYLSYILKDGILCGSRSQAKGGE